MTSNHYSTNANREQQMGMSRPSTVRITCTNKRTHNTRTLAKAQVDRDTGEVRLFQHPKTRAMKNNPQSDVITFICPKCRRDTTVSREHLHQALRQWAPLPTDLMDISNLY